MNIQGEIAVPSREEKHRELLSIYYQVNEVVCRLDALNGKLGVYNKVTDCQAEPAKESREDPDTLVEVVDRLPSMVGDKCSKLHELLNQLEECLI